MLKSKLLWKVTRAAFCALVLSTILPVTAIGQRRWRGYRPHRSRVVVYNYQRQPHYTYRTDYPQSYYRDRYSTYRYAQPYYGTRYYTNNYPRRYSYRYSTYSYPNSYYTDYRYRQRYRNNGFRISIWGR
jgi:hypothetical protein